MFYAAFLCRLPDTRFHLLTALSGGVLMWAIVRNAGIDFGWKWHQLHLGLVRVLFPFMVGVTLYRLHRSMPAKRAGNGLAALLCLLLILSLAGPPDILGPLPWTLGFAFVVAPALVWFGARVQIGSHARTACVFLGAISYPVYATHQPVLRLIQIIDAKFSLSQDIKFALYALAVIGCFFLAWALMQWFEEPLRRLLRTRLFAT